MNEPEQHEDELRDVLHHTVDHIHSSPDLAQRVENAAKRRRAARRSATGAMALIAAVTAGVLAADHVGVHRGASATYSTAQVQLPACAADESAYHHAPATASSTPAPAATGPVVPGSPVAAVLCRYGTGGNLAASATITSQAQLGRLQAAMDLGQAYSGVMYCMQGGFNAVVVFAYPQSTGTGDLTVRYDGACASLYTKAGSYLVRGDVYTLITEWTGG